MPASANPPVPAPSSFFSWLAYELAPREGRAGSVARMAIGCSLTVAIAMVFQIPEPTYMAYIVFLISKDEKAATFLAAVGGQAAVTIAIVITLGLFAIDLSEPALRLPMMAAMTFLAMFSTRVFALGPITYLAGFVFVLLQSLVDNVPNPERLTRMALWVWVVLFVPIVITLILNVLFAPSVALLRRREFRRITADVSEALRDARLPVQLARLRERVVELLDKKARDEPDSPATSSVNSEVLRRLLNLLILLESVTPEIAASRGAAWADQLDEILLTAARVAHEPHWKDSPDVSPNEPPAALAIDSAIRGLRQALTEAPSTRSEPSAEKTLIAPDAMTNPAYWQFALKTTFAVMIVYSMYALLDWPGMRTAIVTCFFVALGSLGETIHKLTLRIAGALLGGLLAGLCIVFVLPHLTDIGQLCLLIFGVSAAAAWIATSSEQLAYGGMQIAFAFFLGILQGYAPATDLTVLRDRVAGIVLGNVVITIVFSTLWPQSAAARVRAAFGQVLRALQSLIDSPENGAVGRERAARGLVLAERFGTLRGFELQMVPGHAPAEQISEVGGALARLEGAIFVSTWPEAVPGFRDSDRVAFAAWANEAAVAAEAGRSWPAPPTLLPGCSAASNGAMNAARQVTAAAAVTESAP
jgi:multidrug resistance protein MdtO